VNADDAIQRWSSGLPADWRATKLRFICTIRNSNVDKKTYDDGNPIRLCNYTDVYYHDFVSGELDLMEATATDKEVAAFGLREGDVLITKDSETPDDIAVPACAVEPLKDVVCGYHLTLLRPLEHEVDGRFLLRALQATGIRDQFYSRATGITRFGLGLDDIKGAVLPLPPLPTQKAIAAYLDRKTAAIDALIEKKEKLIALLAEKRAALINRAVTKGLNPDVPMKDSGVPWIGEIPAHWEMSRVKNVCDFVTSGPRGWGQYYSDNGPLFLRITNVPREGVDLLLDDEKRQSVSPPVGAEGERTLAVAGDVLVTITADLGSVGVVPEGLGEAYISQHLALCRPKGVLLSVLAAYMVRGPWGRVHYEMSMAGGTKVGLGLDDVRDTPLAVPPHDEQTDLSSYLTSVFQRFERACRALVVQRDHLREYRQALITAAVTGQLDVPHEVTEWCVQKEP
jgi:type I restriction enzyme S subunit